MDAMLILAIVLSLVLLVMFVLMVIQAYADDRKAQELAAKRLFHDGKAAKME